MRRALPFLLAFFLALAGCLGTDESSGSDKPDASSTNATENESLPGDEGGGDEVAEQIPPTPVGPGRPYHASHAIDAEATSVVLVATVNNSGAQPARFEASMTSLQGVSAEESVTVPAGEMAVVRLVLEGNLEMQREQPTVVVHWESDQDVEAYGSFTVPPQDAG